MTGNIAVPKTFLSFLPHRCKTLAGTSVDVDATVMNPGFFTATDVTRDDVAPNGLQKIVNRRVLEDGVASPKHAVLRDRRFALVDLTGPDKLSNPKFAGHREKEQGGLGSLAKTACMFAAFQLKFDLEELSRQKGLTTDTALFPAARAAWEQTQKRDATSVTSIFPSGPKIELLGKFVEVDGKPIEVPHDFAAPDLERMFDVTPDGSGGAVVKFKGSDAILVDPAASSSAPHISPAVRNYVARTKENPTEVAKLSFAERLFLMIDESDNAAAQSCIQSVSFLYIASALWQSDIYRPERGGGLWEASTHFPGGVRWTPPPVPRGAKGTDFVSATAASVASLFTLMEQGRLVNPDACAGMKQLTSKKKAFGFGSLTKSFFEEGLRPLGFDRLHSKLGIGDFNNDAAIIERTIVPDPADPSKNKQIRYVAAGFDDRVPDRGRSLRTLIVELDKCIQENNGLISASTP
jgi:hypothetical protein